MLDWLPLRPDATVADIGCGPGYFTLPAGHLAMLRDLVRPDGWLAILDWERRRNPGPGPPLESRVPPEESAAALAAAGWRTVARRAPSAWTYFFLANQTQ